MARAGFIKMSFHSGRKDRVKAFMKVVLSVEWLGTFMKRGRLWNMKKTMMATGWESFLLSRYSFFIGLSAMYHWTNFHIQLKDKLIPTFKAAHGPGYQAQFLIDNSQGHSTYGQDAPLVSCMNIWPGGKQAHMHNGWFIWDGMKIIQPMIFCSNDTQNTNQPNGIKALLVECGLWQEDLPIVPMAKLTYVKMNISLSFEEINYPSSRSFLHAKLSWFASGIRNPAKFWGGKTFAQFMQCLSDLHHRLFFSSL